MASDTALNLVNRIFRLTGDYSPVTTVVGSPSQIAERAIDFLNITLQDLTKVVEFDILNTSFLGTGDGTNSVFIGTVTSADPGSTIVVTVGNQVLEEVTRRRMQELRTEVGAAYPYLPQYFTRVTDTAGNVGVDIYPTPAVGAIITVLAQQNPTLFTVSDTSTTEITNNDLLVTGAIAHMDAFSGMERGYMQLYEEQKKRLWVNTFEKRDIRITTEDYH